jgi:hypothetical protein
VDLPATALAILSKNEPLVFSRPFVEVLLDFGLLFLFVLFEKVEESHVESLVVSP